MTTIYTMYRVAPLYGQPGTGGWTRDPDEAEQASRNGHRVTAYTEATTPASNVETGP